MSKRGWEGNVSGPRGGRAVVVSPAELESRAMLAAGQRYARARDQFNVLAGSLGLYGEECSAAQDAVSGDSAAVGRSASQLEAAIPGMRARVSRHRVRSALASIPRVRFDFEETHVGETVSSSPELAAQSRTSNGSEHVSGNSTEGVRDLRQKIEKIVGAVVAETSASLPTGLSTRVDSTLQLTDEVQLRMAYGELRLEAQRILDEHRLRETRAKRRAEILAVLDDGIGESSAGLRAKLDQMVPGHELPVTLAEATSAVRADLAAADAAFVEVAVGEVLSELGYEVADSMTVTVAKGGVLLEIPGHSSHAARLHVHGDQLRYNVVRLDSSGTEGEDLNAEAHACAVVDEVQGHLRGAGVDWELSRSEPPGAVPVGKARRDSQRVLAKQRSRSKRRRQQSGRREMGS